MRPPYEVTSTILKQIVSISEKIGQINARFLDRPAPHLRKENRIKTIHSSLSIEGNTLSEEQVTALMDNKRVIGPEKDVNEVLNAIRLYNDLHFFKAQSIDSLLKAHEMLMTGLIADNGKFRKKGVSIVAGNQIAHMAPPAENVPYLMQDLFDYLGSSEELSLIKSCVFHYELEFIHPFTDGNGRMGRLWQTLILMEEYPIFEYLPFENIIHSTQGEYYAALSKSDKLGNSTPFIEYMLQVIDEALTQMMMLKNQMNTVEDRLTYFCQLGHSTFTRKDYLKVFNSISTATASRDLKQGVDSGLFEKTGDKTTTLYRLVQSN